MKTKSEIWFEKLKDIWLRKAADEVTDLVAEEFRYFEDPFEKPITDAEKLIEVWKEVKEQEIELLEIKPTACGENVGCARYRFIAMINGERHESRGAYIVWLSDDGLATEFRQWWNEL